MRRARRTRLRKRPECGGNGEAENEDGANSEAAATGQVDAGITLGVVTEHDFARAHGFRGDASIGLQTDSEVGSGSSGTGAADNFVAGAQGDGRSGGAGEMLSAFGDGADCGFKVKLRGVNFGFVADGDCPETRYGMGGVGHAKLATLGQRWSVVTICGAHVFRIGYGAQQVANEIVQFHVDDEMRGLLSAHGPAEHAGQAEQGAASASQAIGLAVVADQLTLYAESGRLQRNKN